MYIGEPRISVNSAAKSTFEELLYFTHTSNMSIRFNHQHTQITKMSGTKMSQNRQTPKHLQTHNTALFPNSAPPNPRISQLNPTPGFGYPKLPPWETWKKQLHFTHFTGGRRLEPLATRRQPGNPLWWLKARARRALRIPGWLALVNDQHEYWN